MSKSDLLLSWLTDCGQFVRSFRNGKTILPPDFSLRVISEARKRRRSGHLGMEMPSMPQVEKWLSFWKRKIGLLAGGRTILTRKTKPSNWGMFSLSNPHWECRMVSSPSFDCRKFIAIRRSSRKTQCSWYICFNYDSRHVCDFPIPMLAFLLWKTVHQFLSLGKQAISFLRIRVHYTTQDWQSFVSPVRQTSTWPSVGAVVTQWFLCERLAADYPLVWGTMI